MTIREMIRKLEVLEEIITAIECCETSYRNDVERYSDRAMTEDNAQYWEELAETAEQKADYFNSYKVMLIKHEIK